MLKRFGVALAALFAFVQVATAAGTISFSFSQQLDPLGKPLSGCYLYVYQAGTVATPQDSFQDLALTIKHPWPLRCDNAGRLPQFFLADGQIKVRITDQAGVNQNYPNGAGALDNILVIGPSSGGGGGGGSVDPTTIIATGDLKVRYDTSTINGFVRANGRTIGSATSGATERANADTQALFVHLCLIDTNLVMTPARSGNCANDYAANKQLALPDWRGRALAGLDDMGSSAAGRLTMSYFGLQFGQSPTVLGAAGGKESHLLTVNQLPSHIHNNVLTDPGHRHPATVFDGLFQGQTGTAPAAIGGNKSDFTASAITGISITNAPSGGDLPHPIVPPMMLATFYIKL